jgi:glycosyltransferase involved in cell wall biosynthesis
MSVTAVTSVVIAAHNEAAVLGRCLDSLLAGAEPGEFEIVVVANGCSDATAEVAAARPGVRVVDMPAPGKIAALNAGDALASGFPRVYLDADIVLPTDGLRALRDALAPDTGVLAAAPRREVDVSRSPAPVRAYYAISSRLPAFSGALFGRGTVALSAAGRAAFDQFPDVVADDLFLDSLFTAGQKVQVDSVSALVAAPRSTRDLLRRLVRVRRGNASLRAALAAEGGRRAGGPGGPQVRRSARSSWLRDVALAEPRLLPAAACYAAITVTAAVAARLPARSASAWGRDESSRAEDVPAQAGGPQ